MENTGEYLKSTGEDRRDTKKSNRVGSEYLLLTDSLCQQTVNTDLSHTKCACACACVCVRENVMLKALHGLSAQ